MALNKPLFHLLWSPPFDCCLVPPSCKPSFGLLQPQRAQRLRSTGSEHGFEWLKCSRSLLAASQRVHPQEPCRRLNSPSAPRCVKAAPIPGERGLLARSEGNQVVPWPLCGAGAAKEEKEACAVMWNHGSWAQPALCNDALLPLFAACVIC